MRQVILSITFGQSGQSREERFTPSHRLAALQQLPRSGPSLSKLQRASWLSGAGRHLWAPPTRHERRSHVTLVFGLVFGVIGSAYMLYGRRQHEPWYLVIGFALIIYPYFISGVFLTLLIGALLLLLSIGKQREWF